jgi:hypothetical protein
MDSILLDAVVDFAVAVGSFGLAAPFLVVFFCLLISWNNSGILKSKAAQVKPGSFFALPPCCLNEGEVRDKTAAQRMTEEFGCQVLSSIVLLSSMALTMVNMGL